jgi:hypothetical protein
MAARSPSGTLPEIVCARAGLASPNQCGDQAAEDHRAATAKHVAPANAIFIRAP